MDIVIVVIIVGIILFLVVSKWGTHGRIKARGVRTVGRVLGMRSESGTTSTYSTYSPGGFTATPYTVHTMSYEFDVEGGRFGPFKKAVGGSMANKKAGDQIIVYYLPENPWKHTVT